MKLYIVIYSDYDCDYDIRGIFTDESKAEKCKEYELRRIGQRGYGERIDIIHTKLSDDVDFSAKLTELEERKRQEQQKIEAEIKAADLAEFNRIKEKYNL